MTSNSLMADGSLVDQLHSISGVLGIQFPDGPAGDELYVITNGALLTMGHVFRVVSETDWDHREPVSVNDREHVELFR